MTRPFNAVRFTPLLLLALVVPLRTASAHPRLLHAAPAIGDRIAVVPRQVSLTFSEAVTVGLCRLTLLDAVQRPVALDSLRAAPGDAKTVTAKILSVLRPGRYTVKWQAGGADGHPVRGEYSFVVQTVPSSLTKPETQPPQPDFEARLAATGVRSSTRVATR